MSAAKKKRSNRPSSHRREPRHVAPVLDPNWQNPYSPSTAERESNRTAIRTMSWRRVRGLFVASVALLVLTVAVSVLGVWVKVLAGWWWPIGGLLAVGTTSALYHAQCRHVENSLGSVANRFLAAFTLSGDATAHVRLSTIVDRLGATFGIADITSYIVTDEAYNAALLPGDALVLVVTSALLDDFDLIEIEGVIAHLMARQRLGQLERLAAACVVSWEFTASHALAGVSGAYRADEVAAAAIRFPLGLLSALNKCADQVTPTNSKLNGELYSSTRWVWFNQFGDRSQIVDGDLDDPRVRSRALSEW